MRRIGVLGLAAAVAVATVAAWAQQEQYAGLETVRSVSVGVVLVAADGREVERSAAEDLTTADLRVLVDGVETAATSLAATASGSASEPWQFLIYVDAALSPRDLVTRSLAALGARAEALAELGTVELVVADPIPRRLLAPTRDHSMIDAAVSGLSLSPTAADALVALRAQLRADDPSGAGRADLARQLLTREVELVRRQQDRLLSWLVTHAEPASHRVLFLVSGGFDLHPEAFYAAGLEQADRGGETRLPSDYSAVTRAVAGYGWLAVVLQRPVPDPLPRRWGLRRQLLVRLDGNWDPERAEAELELGESLIGQEKWKRAEAALERSIHAFYGQPRLRGRQAHVLSRLGYVLQRQERTSEAQQVLRKAIELDPSMAEQLGSGVAGLLDPLAPLAELAEMTAGGIVRDAGELGRLLDGLRYRSRMTFQLAGSNDSGLHRLEVSARSGAGKRRLLAPQWVRSATPEAVSAARARRLLEDELEAAADEQALGFDRLSLRCDLDPAGPEALVEIDAVTRLPEGWDGVASVYRVSVAVPTTGSVRVDHRMESGGVWTPGREWEFTDRFAADADEPYLAVIVEEMNTGRWSGSLLECEESF